MMPERHHRRGLAARPCTRLRSYSESPRLDAEVLLGKVLGVPRSALIVRAPEPVAADALHRYQSLIERRASGTPVAYLTGTREFWSLQLDVTPAVLVPRPETETLVELALRLLPVDGEPSVLDLGTGSGAIALAVAAERPRARVTGVDISPAALGVARRNAAALGLPRVAWRLGSWFEPVAGERFDLIVANPPYVADTDPALAKLADEPLHCAALGADRIGIARGDHRAGSRAPRTAGMGAARARQRPRTGRRPAARASRIRRRTIA